MGQVWRCFESESVIARLDDLVVVQSAGGTNGTIIHENHSSNDAADGFGAWSGCEPFVQGAALVRFKVAEGNVAERCRIDDFRYGLSNLREDLLHPGLKQQGFVVFDQKLVKLEIKVGNMTSDVLISAFATTPASSSAGCAIFLFIPVRAA
jgi:hypothetical protein